MSDFLSYVERNYGCVAEYNRCREEDMQHEYELQEKARQYYKKNNELRKKAQTDGSYVVFCDDCFDCPSYTDIGMTDADDDIPHGICGDLSCVDCKYRKRERSLK